MHHALCTSCNSRSPDRVDPETDGEERPGQERIEPPPHFLYSGRHGFQVVIGIACKQGRKDEREKRQEGE